MIMSAPTSGPKEKRKKTKRKQKEKKNSRHAMCHRSHIGALLGA
jgi:hypothetical protein